MKSESRHPCIVVAHVQVSGMKGKWNPKESSGSATKRSKQIRGNSWRPFS
jgi:hypothetical protein